MRARRNDVFIRIFSILLVLLLFAGMVGVFVFFTNGFTDNFKAFYIEHNGKKITQNDELILKTNTEYRFDCIYALDKLINQKPKDFTVKLTPNAGIDFEFAVDNDIHKYSEIEDLTHLFVVNKKDTYFVISVPSGFTIKNTLQSFYEGKTITLSSDVVDYGLFYSLVVTSYDGKTTHVFNFSVDVDVTDISLDKEVILF